MSDVDLFQMIGNFGFPIVMTIYLLHRFEKKIERLEEVVQELAKIISFKRK